MMETANDNPEPIKLVPLLGCVSADEWTPSEVIELLRLPLFLIEENRRGGAALRTEG